MHHRSSPVSPRRPGSDTGAIQDAFNSTQASAITEVKALHSQSIDRKRWDRYSIRGRVFAVFTCKEDMATENGKEEPNLQRVRSRRHTHPVTRRMVVVGKRGGYCWAIQINTYSSQGMAKPTFKEADIEFRRNDRFVPKGVLNARLTGREPLGNLGSCFRERHDCHRCPTEVLVAVEFRVQTYTKRPWRFEQNEPTGSYSRDYNCYGKFLTKVRSQPTKWQTQWSILT